MHVIDAVYINGDDFTSSVTCADPDHQALNNNYESCRNNAPAWGSQLAWPSPRLPSTLAILAHNTYPLNNAGGAYCSWRGQQACGGLSLVCTGYEFFWGSLVITNISVVTTCGLVGTWYHDPAYLEKGSKLRQRT